METIEKKKAIWVLKKKGRNVSLYVNKGNTSSLFKKVYSDRAEYFKSRADLRNNKISLTKKQE